MKLFAAEETPGRGRHLVVLFGSGLIGSAIEEGLRSQASWTVDALPYAWEDGERRRADLAGIIGRLEASSAVSPGSRCDVIWAAGVNGFGATQEQMEREVAIVAELCRATARLARCNAGLSVAVHLISSGGGLFEGKKQIGRDTEPAPLRPYGLAKLEQERLLLAADPLIKAHIYRPASVYGFKPGARLGLFATLIVNALANRSTLISGTERTIRDYVLARDIGGFVAGKVLHGSVENETYLLASGKPTCMFEVLSKIERLIGRPIYRRFESKASNALDLSFAQSGLPSGWVPTSLEAGLASLKAKIDEAVVRSPAR